MDGQERSSVSDIDRQIAELQRKKQGMTVVDSRAEAEVTVVMATYNAWMWLGRAIFSIEIGAQSMPVNLIICDNTSTDPTGEILKSRGFKSWLQSRAGLLDVDILDPVPRIEMEIFGTPDNPVHKPFASEEVKKNRNIDFMFTKLTRHVKTPYILYLDADVGMPSGAVAEMLMRMKANEKLAMLGIRYTFESNLDHVQLGCTMARTETILKVVGQFDSRTRGCLCRDATFKLKAAGYSVEHLNGWVARHFKNEMP